MFGPKCRDVETGEFVGDCQILDKLIKELLADGFAEKRSRGWHSLVAQNYTTFTQHRVPSLTVPQFLGFSNILDIDLARSLHE